MLGGNDPATPAIIDKAITMIRKEAGPILKSSGYYTSAAWGPVQQPDFINIALILQSKLPPVMLLNILLSIENRLGRKRTVKYGPRTIDIDILFYGNRIIRHKDLTVPHPEIPNRKFVLIPCNEILPTLMHPVLQTTIHDLLLDCNDPLEVKKWIR